MAPGEVGELLTRTTDSAEMFAGYWEMPEATSEAMAGGWYHTSDAARMDAQGYVYFLERMKDRIRHRGENVSPFDVETTLHRHPGVAKCAVVGIPSVQYGEDEIVVFAVPAGDDVDSESVAAFAERELPKFMRPSRVVMVSELPETTTGKVQRAVLRARLLDEDGSDAQRGAHRAPRRRCRRRDHRPTTGQRARARGHPRALGRARRPRRRATARGGAGR